MKDQVVVITGGSAGIGAELAKVAVARGARGVVIAARRQAELAAVAQRLGPSVLAVPTDVTRRAEVERLRDRALERFGQIDIWVNNAGRGITRLPSQLTDDDVDTMITDNLKSVLYGIQAVLPHFRERKRGHIVAISSGLARFPLSPLRSIYSATKAAVNMLIANLRAELRADYPDICCAAIMPGIVATEFGKNALNGGPDNAQMPGAQSVEDCAAAIADAIAQRRVEAYTRPGMHQLAARYYGAEDMAAIEAAPPFTR